MAYIGKQPVVGNFQVCDAISVVNGQAAYTMQVASANVEPENANHMLVSLNGVLQKPGSSFTISGATITFASNLATGDVIDFIILLGDTLNIGTPSDSTVSLAKLTATGTKDATTFLRGDNSFATPDSGLTLIKETNASNVASVSFVHGTSDVVFDSTYKVYFCTFTNILLASDEELFLRILSGGSAQSGSTSYWTGLYGTYGSPTSPNAFNDRYENALWGSPGDVESTIPVSGYVYFYNVGQSSAYPMAMGQMFMQRSNGNHYAMNFSGYYKTAISNFDGFTLTNNGGGNISSGNFKLYGVK